ncbi:MAG: hypothetical protein HKN87_21565 [Saprospiraceae bacterium]|nr:hypothetical protein [Saprospiraceae bacterium]
MITKPRVIKDFEKLAEEIQEQIKLKYPLGFSRHLITFTNQHGQKVSALPFETEEKYFLVRMTAPEAKSIIAKDDDYNAKGVLKPGIREAFEEKYSDDDEDEDEELDIDKYEENSMKTDDDL